MKKERLVAGLEIDGTSGAGRSRRPPEEEERRFVVLADPGM